ncbi:GGDEF domain-containing protein [Pseudomonas violetae]|jgi:diguanylate cyclase (GGDEF)-like protein|uniref:diguanylate cyclase n=1 Tax=Pseudomonas violetae TaxID=2915813 RepID=A0ABT0EU88_9PSED|nr:GGDEF domain-containing protein [Pseudomonas violetae]MCK1789298.1 GGDEF domain-containing protein [Pseudomonas violetae]
MVASGKPGKTGSIVEVRRGRKVLDIAVQDRERMRELAREFEQPLTAVQMASMDELTLLTNLHGFMVLAQLWLDACEQLEKPVSLLYFDLEYFRQINETYGRVEGDKALKTFADVLRVAFRESDVVGRVGGDEFAVLLTGSTAVEEAGIRARLQEMLNERIATAHRGYDICFSIEQMEFDPVVHKTVEGLMTAVDFARHQGAVRF